MTEQYQNIIVGAGHNGLVCAAYLARAGQSVLVLEANDDVGGAACTRLTAGGAKVSAAAHLLYALPAQLNADLDLVRHGFNLAATNLKTISLNESGRSIVIEADSVSGDSVSTEDRMGFARFNADMARFAKLLQTIIDKPAPDIAIDTWEKRLEMLGLAWTLRKLGRTHMRDLLRVIGMNIYDLLGEYFEDSQLKAAVAMDAVLGSEWGPRSMGSVFTYLYRLAGYHGSDGNGLSLPAGGMGAVTSAISSAATASGVTIRTGTPVRRILVIDDRAAGVELATGETIDATRVISNADPKRTFLELVDVDHLDTGFVRRISNIRSKGRAAKLHLVLDGLPEFRGVSTSDAGARMLIAPTPDDIELAFNPCKYGKYPASPVMEIVIPSVSDESLAAPGQHVLSAVVQYLPYDDSPAENENRNAVLETALAQIERYAPGIRQLIIESELLTPHDIERQFGMTGGHWHHVELALESFLVNRPAPMLSRHGSPIAGLYLCGAGCHPGGNVMGIAGRNAALQILKEAR